MAGGNGHVIDRDGEARRALQAVVAEHGAAALSDAVLMDGIGRDRLAGLRGEAIMIRIAAQSDVPALLREQAGRLSIDDAIESVAASLAKAHSLKKPACVWVVSEFARALGYAVPGQSQPAAGPAQDRGAAGGPPLGTGGADRARTRGPNRGALGLFAATALVGAYLGVAAVAHLSPWDAKVAANSPRALGTASAQATPDGSPSPASGPAASTPRSPYATLLNMIPGDVRHGACKNLSASYEALGAVAVIGCNRVPRLDAGALIYWLFPDSVTLTNGYDRFLNGNHFHRGRHLCSNKKFVASCEAAYSGGSPSITGTVAEHLSPRTNFPIITCIATGQLVMVEMAGKDGDNLVKYFGQLRWIAPGTVGVPR